MWKSLKGPHDDFALDGAKCEKCGTIYESRRDSPVTYVCRDGKYVCSKCGGGIDAENRAHPIHDGPFPLSGSGQCYYEQVPYCPKCETKPAFHGSFITVPSDV